MFSKISDASKVGFYFLVEKMKAKKYKLIDCQMYTTHLRSLGAELVNQAKAEFKSGISSLRSEQESAFRSEGV